MKIVVSLGGSVIIPKDVNVAYVKHFVKLIKKYRNKHKFSIVCGGGNTARIYIKPARKLGIDRYHADELGIMATHMNAKFMSLLLGAKFSEKDPVKIGKMPGMITSGGYRVGCTTDTDAALIAKSMKADMVINITDVKGIYTADPHKNPKAKMMPRMNWKTFEKMFGKKVTGAGINYVFDPLAGQICKKNKIKVVVTSTNLKNLENIFRGKRFVGTLIS